MALTGQWKTLISCVSDLERVENQAKCLQCGNIWPLESIKTKLKQLRCGAPNESRPLKRRRTTAVWAEIEAAVNETPAGSEHAPSAQLTGHVALDVVAVLHDDLQTRRFKPLRAPK